MRLRTVLDYGAAATIVLAVLALSLLGRPLLARSPSDLFFAGVAVSAWLGGLGPALVAAVLSVLALDFFFLDPLYAIDPLDPGDIVSLLAFLVVALLVSALSANLRRARDRAEVARVVTEASAREREGFIRMVVHDLKSPMTAIRGYAQMLALRNDPPPRASEIIVRQTDRLNRLTCDLLATTGLGEQPFPLHPIRTDLLTLIGDAMASASQRAPGHTIRLITGAQRVEGYWDQDRIAQVIENLLGNAVKYSPEGGTIQIHVRATDTRVEVSIRDDGPGIPRDTLGRLFDQFYRGQDVADGVPGQGLGLYISRQIVESHGGQLWADSDGPGWGSAFTFGLPIGEAAAAPGPALSGGHSGGSRRVHRVRRIRGASHRPSDLPDSARTATHHRASVSEAAPQPQPGE